MERKSLKDRLKQFTNAIPFMEGRERGDLKDVCGRIVTICDYGFMAETKKSKDPVVVLALAEYPDKFFFGGQVITEQMRQLDDEGYREEILADGIPVVFENRTSKATGNPYMAANYDVMI